MTGQTRTQYGSCRCGQVRFKVVGDPLVTMACHCSGCQRMTSSAFSLSALFASDRFEVTAGDPVIGGLNGSTRHFFCPHCMSWLYTQPEGMDEVVNVRATLLDDAHAFRPFIETYASEALPWATTPAVHRFEKLPPMDQYPALLAEFAEQVERENSGSSNGAS